MTLWALGVFDGQVVRDADDRCEAPSWAEAVELMLAPELLAYGLTAVDLADAIPGKVATPTGMWFVVEADRLHTRTFTGAAVDQVIAGVTKLHGGFAP